MFRLVLLAVVCSVSLATRNVYDGCGTIKGCFGTPRNCESSSNCLILVTYRSADEFNYEFELFGRVYDSENSHVAVGFTTDTERDYESATECALLGGKFQLYNMHNRPTSLFKSNRRLPEMEQTSLNLTGSTFSDGYMYCRFSRPKVQNVAGRELDLTQPWHLLIAAGGITEGSLAPSEDGVLGRTSHPVSLDDPNPQPLPSSEPTGAHLVYTGCGRTKGCFGRPSNCINSESCDILVTYRNYSATQFEFELYGATYSSKKHKSAGSYVAVGFSEDRRMGDDMVVECSVIGEKPAVAMSYNEGHHNQRFSNPNLGVELVEGREENGFIYCRLLRDGVIEDGGQSFDIANTDYHLLIAAGPADVDRIHEHTSEAASQDKVHLNDFGGAVVRDVEFLVSWHGILMTVAWMLLVSSASFLPRHHKQSWGQRQLFQSAVWFSLHRFLNGLALFLTLYSVVIIFIAVAGWVNTDDPIANAHAVMGIIITALVFLQPLGTFLRPSPDHPKRWIFNLCHALAGYSLYILAVVNMFLGAILRDGIKPWAKWIIVAFAVVYILVQIAHALFKRAPMKSTSVENILGRPKDKVSAIEIVWYCYVLVAVGLTTAVIMALV